MTLVSSLSDSQGDMANIERWTITPAHRAKDVEGNTFGLTTRVEPRLEYGGESFEVVRAANYQGVVTALGTLRTAALYFRADPGVEEYGRALQDALDLARDTLEGQ